MQPSQALVGLVMTSPSSLLFLVFFDKSILPGMVVMLKYLLSCPVHSFVGLQASAQVPFPVEGFLPLILFS